MKNKRLISILIVIVFLLLIPFIAMQFTTEVNWTLMDFVIAGFLLIGTGLVFEIILRKVKSRRFRIISSLILLLILVLIWVELAVGILGSPIIGN